MASAPLIGCCLSSGTGNITPRTSPNSQTEGLVAVCNLAQQMIASQTWDPQRYARNARLSVIFRGRCRVACSGAGRAHSDLGCGDGVLTAKLAAMDAMCWR